ncbi:hypothetical protein NVP1170O_043 [Vibrio phage 1.170.O._10N.261.52.C3]|nr:hypothetical protein NVP1170O_043 [Vibrio phage 1.170.O._10N.261.52.C3]
MSYFYESSNITVGWNGLNLSQGWAEDTFISVTMNSERVTYKAGADGTYTYSKQADKGCTITMTFTDVAPINLEISAMMAAQDLIGAKLPVSPFLIIDRTGNSAHFLASNAVLTEVSDVEFGASSGERTWTWVCETFIASNDLSSITSNLKGYLVESDAQESGAV